jgi:hypothetical protein
MTDHGNAPDISKHEAGHAVAFWLLGGKVKSVVAARNGLDRDVVPDGCGGICAGEFPGSDLVVNEATKIIAEKRIETFFAGGIAEGNADATAGDMNMAILSMGWAGHRYAHASREAIDLVEKHGLDIPIEERSNFFKRHSKTFGGTIQGDDAQAAIAALTDAIDQAPGHTIRGREAVVIFEKVYEGKLPDGVLPMDYHGELSDKLLSPERTIDDCVFYLNFCLKRLDDADIDDKVELARISVIRAILEVSALL